MALAPDQDPDAASHLRDPSANDRPDFYRLARKRLLRCIAVGLLIVIPFWVLLGSLLWLELAPGR